MSKLIGVSLQPQYVRLSSDRSQFIFEPGPGGARAKRMTEQPFELFEELVCFSAKQLGLDAGLIELYRKRQPTISEHHNG
jgi:hypothetical protein